MMDKIPQPEQIEIPVWWKNGGWLTRRDCLPFNHPEHTYNYIKDQMGLEPENYGVMHPMTEAYKDYTREQLLGEISKLKIELENFHKWY